MENKQIKTSEEFRKLIEKAKAEREEKAKAFMERIRSRVEEIKKAREAK